ncbi:MAG: ribonuclease E inhibitor RraB, partial [Pirellula sp.]
PSLLESAVEKLEGMGLSYVDIFLSEKESEDEPDLFWLHMEEIRVHSPQSLDKRNDEFYLFADQEGFGSYDGMDVGPVQ